MDHPLCMTTMSLTRCQREATELYFVRFRQPSCTRLSSAPTRPKRPNSAHYASFGKLQDFAAKGDCPRLRFMIHDYVRVINFLLLLIIIICPIAIAYSMGQIIKSVCVCQCVSLSVRLRALSRSHFLIDFHQNWHRRKYSQVVARA